jgi:hypothetical protein
VAQATNAPTAVGALHRIGELLPSKLTLAISCLHSGLWFVVVAPSQSSTPCAWLEAQLPLLSRRSTLAEAIRYALARWHGLIRFLHDGRTELVKE